MVADSSEDLAAPAADIPEMLPGIVDSGKPRPEADPHVVALAARLQKNSAFFERRPTVVTEEADRPNKIPRAGGHYGMPSTNFRGLLWKEGWRSRGPSGGRSPLPGGPVAKRGRQSRGPWAPADRGCGLRRLCASQFLEVPDKEVGGKAGVRAFGRLWQHGGAGTRPGSGSRAKSGPAVERASIQDCRRPPRLKPTAAFAADQRRAGLRRSARARARRGAAGRGPAGSPPPPPPKIRIAPAGSHVPFAARRCAASRTAPAAVLPHGASAGDCPADAPRLRKGRGAPPCQPAGTARPACAPPTRATNRRPAPFCTRAGRVIRKRPARGPWGSGDTHARALPPCSAS